MKKKPLLKDIDWRRLIVILCVFTILTFLPMAVYLYLSKTMQSVAQLVSDNFDDVTLIDEENSTNYSLSGGVISTIEAVYDFGTGSDGACTVSVDTNINTGTCVGRANGDAVNYRITTAVTAGSNHVTVGSTPVGFAVGDEILIINLQGTSSDYSHVGEYETAYITGIDTKTLSLDRELTYGYDGTTQMIMVQRVPQYTNVTINAGKNFYPSAWSGNKGGVMAFRASGTVTITGTIHANAMGYTATQSFCGIGGGAGGVRGTSCTSGGAGACGGGGGGGADRSWTTSCSSSGGLGSAALGGAGGSGGQASGSTGIFGGCAGGGGYGTYGYKGSNGSATNGGTNSSGNGEGGFLGWNDNLGGPMSYGGGGGGGGTYGEVTLSNIFYGSAGGSGGYAGGASGAGGAGGGIVMIFGDTISVSGSIKSNGANGGNGANCGDLCGSGGGGGGAGGSIKIIGDDITLGSGLVTANGGTGGSDGRRGTVGGAGGSGRIRVEYANSVSGTSSPTLSSAQLPDYYDTMVLQSTDLISGDITASIQSFIYNLSSKPDGTSASIQYSMDATTWYNSSGVEDGSDELTIGEDNSIDLTGLEWQTSTFYYKITFTTNSGVATPVLDDISLNYDTAPVAPTAGTPEALSTNTIRWNFTDNSDDETGFVLTDEEDNVVQYCLGEDLSYCDETGLEENTQYSRKIKAYNDLGESETAQVVSSYTLVSTPSLFPGGSKTSSSLTLSASGQVNGSEVYIDCLDEGCDTGINTWTSDSIAEVTSLNFNTPYIFKVKGRNGDNVETNYSDSVTIYTLAEVPSLSLSPLSESSISLTAENVNNESSGGSGVYFECEDEDYNEGISEWVQTVSDTVTGLDPNTLYFFRVKARNYDSVETAFGDYVGVYTKAGVPSSPLLINQSTNSLTLALDEDTNPLGTKYAVMEENSGKYIDYSTNLLVTDPVWGSYENFGGENGMTVNGLDIGTEYLFKVKARNEDEIETDFSEPTSMSTKLNTPTALSAVTITSSSITWRVTDDNGSKVGYKIYDTSNNLVLTCLANAMENCVERNLLSNTSYSRKVKVYSENSESDFSNTFVVSTYSAPSTIASVVPTGAGSVRLNIVGSSRDNLQILETTSNQYLNGSLNILTGTSSLLPYSNSVDVVGLSPNTKVEFKVRSLNRNNVATSWSSVQSTYTYAEEPEMVKVERVSGNSVRVYIDSLNNPADTELLVVENNSAKYLDFSTGTLSDTEKWGISSNFGSTNGIIVNDLETGGQFGFSVKARNKLMVETEWSEPFYIGTTAILKNVNEKLKATLVSEEDLDLTLPENGQYGEKTVRVKEGDLIIADIPVLFSQDRDWTDAVLLSSVTERKTVIKLTEDHGLADPFTMYVVRDDTNAFLLCPNATTLEEVSPNCEDGIEFTGDFPQSITFEGNKLSISKTVLGGVDYWVADGVSGTGGYGYYYEEEETGFEEVVEEITPIITNPVKTVKERAKGIAQIIKDKALGVVDNLPIKDLEESELQTVAATANVVTITVGTTAFLGGLTQLGYSIVQFFTVFLSSIGFKKKRVSYGFVYDSNSKEPIHMALVRIYNRRKRLVETAVTDSNGRFAGSLKRGMYTLTVSKSGYEFPSMYIKGSTDFPLQNVYTGSLEIKAEDAEIQIAVPVDPKEILGGKKVFYIIKNITLKTLSILNIFIFLGGVSISVYTYYIHSNANNLVILILYIIPLYVLLHSLFNKKGKYGKVIDEKGKPISEISVIIREKEFNKIVAKRVTNKKGLYRFILDKGKYELDVNEKDYDLVEIKRGSLIDVRKDNYVLAKKIKIKKV